MKVKINVMLSAQFWLPNIVTFERQGIGIPDKEKALLVAV
jgi:hypothetical protein